MLYSLTSIKRSPSGGTLKTGCLTKVGRLIEVQYTFGRNGSQRDFIDSISGNMVVERCTYVNVHTRLKTIIVTKHQVHSICAFTAICCCQERSCNDKNNSFAFLIIGQGPSNRNWADCECDRRCAWPLQGSCSYYRFLSLFLVKR